MMKSLFSYLPVSLFSLLTSLSFAQQSRIFVEPGIHAGRIIKHTTPFPDIKNNTFSLEINVAKKPGGNKLWHRLYHLSAFGLGIVYSDFGDNAVLGKAVGILPNLTFSKGKNKIRFYYTLGTGLAYLTKPYDIFVNENNNVIGSHINNLSYLNFGFEWQLGKSFCLKPSISLIHYSNGRVKLPNLGYNVPSISVFGKFFLLEEKQKTKADSTPAVNKKLKVGMELGYGRNQLVTSRGPLYPVYSGKIFLCKNFTLKNKVSAGIEYAFDKGIYSSLIIFENYKGDEFNGASRIICFLSHEFIMGHLSLLTQGGFFLNTPANPGTKFPTKLGIQYYFFTPYFREKHHFYCGIYLAAHSFEADYTAVAAGFIF